MNKEYGESGLHHMNGFGIAECFSMKLCKI